MRTITKEFKIYKYEELSKKAKEKVKQDYINNLDANDFTYMIIEDLNNIGLKSLRPYYSLSYCQGYGLYLAGHIDFDEISLKLKSIFCKDFILSDYKILKILKDYSRIDFNHIGRYYHKNSVEIDIYIDGSFDDRKYNNHKKVANKLIKNVKEWYFDKCNEYEKQGYEFFYGISDEELQEYCNSMDYEFFEDGTILN
ncbi:MAG: hypothetical protein ACI4PR_04405 [Acutalibacteraceae bacterium]